MRIFLLTVGIISLVIGVLSLLFAALNWFGYYNVLDGSAELYVSLQQRMIIFLVIGILLTVVGIVSLIIRSGL